MQEEEYAVAQQGAHEFHVIRKIGQQYHVIATAVNREYAEQIVKSLNNAAAGTEIRRSWND